MSRESEKSGGRDLGTVRNEGLDRDGLIDITADLAAGFAANNQIGADQFPTLITSIFDTLLSLKTRRLDETLIEAASAPVEESSLAGDDVGVRSAAFEEGSGDTVFSEPVVDEFDEDSEPEEDVVYYTPDWEAIRAAVARNPENGRDPATGELIPLEISELVPDEYGHIFDLAWINPDARWTKRPRVPVEQSVTLDSVTNLETGERKQMLTRSLPGRVEGEGSVLRQRWYRERWGLTAHYPLQAPGNRQRQQEHAKRNLAGKGGRKKKVPVPEADVRQRELEVDAV